MDTRARKGQIVNVSKDAKAIVTNEIALKVVDIFGNDTMTIFDVSVGGKKP